MAKQVIFEVVVKGEKEVLELQNRIKQLQKELKNTSDTQVADRLVTELAQLKIELDKARQAAKLAKLEFQAQDDSISAYKRLSAQLAIANERYKDVAVRTGQFSKETKQAQQEVLALQKQIKGVDFAVGNFGRNVGNYAGSLKALGRQIGASINLRTVFSGALAVTDQLQQAIETVSKAIDDYKSATDSAFLVQKQLNEAQKEIVSSYIDERATLDGLLAIANDKNATDAEQNAAKDQLNELYRTYLPNLGKEQLSLEQLNELQGQVNAKIIENIARKQQAAIVENLLNDAIQKSLALEKSRIENTGILGDLLNDQLTTITETSKNAVAQSGTVGETIKKTLKDIEALGFDFAKAYDPTQLSKNSAKFTENEEKEAEKRRDALERELEKRNKVLEKYNQDRAKFEADQGKALLDLQNKLAQAAVDGIEDEGQKAIAQEKLNFGLRKQQRESEYQTLVQQIKDQEQRIIEVFGANSDELAAFRAETAERLLRIQESFNTLSEADAKAHQDKLTDIEAQGQAERDQQAKADMAARIALNDEYLAELESLYALESSKIKEAILKQNEDTEAGRKKILELELQLLAERERIAREQIALNRTVLQTELDITEEQRRDLILKNQQLAEELAAIEEEKTTKVKEEEAKKKAARQEATNFALNSASQAIDLIGQVFAAQAEKEQAQFDSLIEQRQASVDNLNEQLQNASGLQKEFLEQQLKQEQDAINGLERAKEQAARKEAKRQKAFAIAQAVINGALAITNILATVPKFDFGVSTGILIGLAAATTAVQIATIAAQPLATGGIVGQHITGKSIQRDNGDNVLTTLKRGEVVLNSRQQSIIGRDSFARAGVPGFAAGGIVPPVPNVAAQNAIQSPANMMRLLEETNKLAQITAQKVASLEVVYTPNTEAGRVKDEQDRNRIITRSKL